MSMTITLETYSDMPIDVASAIIKNKMDVLRYANAENYEETRQFLLCELEELADHIFNFVNCNRKMYRISKNEITF